MEFFNPTFIASLSAVLVAGIGTWLTWKTKQQTRNMSFRKEYRDEVDPLLDYFTHFMNTSPYENAIETLFTFNPVISKRILQHLYTCEKTRFIYYLVKDRSDGKNITGSQFKAKFFPIWEELRISPFPDFGSCERCLEHIKLKEIQKHRKILEKCDPKMWDLFSKSSESM